MGAFARSLRHIRVAASLPHRGPGPELRTANPVRKVSGTQRVPKIAPVESQASVSTLAV